MQCVISSTSVAGLFSWNVSIDWNTSWVNQYSPHYPHNHHHHRTVTSNKNPSLFYLYHPNCFFEPLNTWRIIQARKCFFSTMVSTVSPLRIGLWDPFQLPQMAYNWGVTNIRYLGWSSKHPISLASDPSKSLFFRRSQRWSWIVFQDPASEYLWQNFAVEKIRGHYLGPHFFFGGEGIKLDTNLW